MRKDVPVILGRIECFPTWMSSWVCPKCDTFHFAVTRVKHENEDVIKCIYCKEVFALNQFRFPEMSKIKSIIRDLAPGIEKAAVKDEEKEMEAEARYGV